MRGTSESTPTRRTVLSTLGAGLAGGLLATGTGTARQSDSQYALVQDDTCVPVRPIRGQLTAETFYGYHLPEQYVADANGAVASERLAYSSAGTTDLQRAKTSIAFLYQGPRGLSLVFVHGKAGADDGGSVTFRLSGVPSGAEWVVKDDLYGDLDGGDLQNYDRWQVDGSDQQVDWTWGSGGTDGGVLRGLGEEFEVVVRPAFNEAAALYGEYYEGTVTDWQFLSGSVAVSKRVPLDLGKPIRIRTGGCEGNSGSDESGQQSGAQGHQSQSQNQDDDDDSDGDDGDEDDGDDDDDSEDGDDGDEDDGDDDDDEGRGPPDHAEGRGPPDHAEGRGPPDRAEGDDDDDDDDNGDGDDDDDDGDDGDDGDDDNGDDDDD